MLDSETETGTNPSVSTTVYGLHLSIKYALKKSVIKGC